MSHAVGQAAFPASYQTRFGCERHKKPIGSQRSQPSVAEPHQNPVFGLRPIQIPTDEHNRKLFRDFPEYLEPIALVYASIEVELRQGQTANLRGECSCIGFLL